MGFAAPAKLQGTKQCCSFNFPLLSPPSNLLLLLMLVPRHSAPSASQPIPCLPEGYADRNDSVDGDSKEAEDGALSQDQDEAGNEEAAIEEGTEASADGDGKGDCQHSHRNVSSSQGHHEVVGDVLQVAVQVDCPADQDVAQDGQHRNDQFQDDVSYV